MRAIVITRPGPPDVLALRDDAPDPVPGPGEILVRVAASAVNRADLLQRAGHYPAPAGWPAEIPGLEYAGEVAAVGEEVERWRVGDRVMGLVGGGGYAELVRVPAEEAIAVPRGLPLDQAAAIPEVFITAHDALSTRAGLRQGETVLIHSIGSGVGTAALQLATAWGCRVIGTSRTDWKVERARELGLHVGIETSAAGAADPTAAEGFAAAVLLATDGAGAAVILDLVGGAYFAGNLECLATLGRHVIVGTPSGRSAELDLGLLMRKRATMIGTVLRSRPPAEKARAAAAFAGEVLPLLESGRVEPVIHDVVPMAEAARAHELVASNETFGKVVLAW